MGEQKGKPFSDMQGLALFLSLFMTAILVLYFDIVD